MFRLLWDSNIDFLHGIQQIKLWLQSDKEIGHISLIDDVFHEGLGFLGVLAEFETMCFEILGTIFLENLVSLLDLF